MVEIPKYLAKFQPDLKDHKKPIRDYENRRAEARSFKAISKMPRCHFKNTVHGPIISASPGNHSKCKFQGLFIGQLN